MGLSYGIIRNVDLDICDEEIKGNLESDLEIVSVRRLKRTTITGEWVESETIRIGCRGSVLLTYVRGYGCSLGRSYKDVIISHPDIDTDKQESTDGGSQQEKDVINTKQRVKRNIKIKKRNKNNMKTESSGDVVREKSDTGMSVDERDDENKGIGDFNAHHSCWSNRSDTRGTQIYDVGLDTGFMTLNNGEYTRIRLKSSPDIIFVSSNIAVKLDWKNLGNEENPQVLFDSLINLINKAENVSIPMIKIPQNPTGKFIRRSYWSPSLSHKVAQRRLALREFRRNPISNNLNVLVKKHSEARSPIYKARAQYWFEFCDSIDEATTSSSMWCQMRWMKGLKTARLSVSEERKFELLCKLAPDYKAGNAHPLNVIAHAPSTFTSENTLNAAHKAQNLRRLAHY
ncbi:unnamed protein product [Leptidea sinapis]|uniref:Endonuclease/exonuclease/phosphatase domain-containing protein n=1 Tax=Leptidea sinapis TaxID=189913 RepID=A0A5E4QIV5_9NEOP|nr:unnamed protein product [Leptidea sinapis]